ncbi:hypothetical protein TNCT_411811 [Trichonephila clavata]|uniref:Uncharacterized protein n=1 Tax=Trichonephila clavata TaxID=2740835 RepID=A0A8X6GS28_TRICU|nr:hypothetical protein TNCT_411811 [Trichonephila clavata]
MIHKGGHGDSKYKNRCSGTLFNKIQTASKYCSFTSDRKAAVDSPLTTDSVPQIRKTKNVFRDVLRAGGVGDALKVTLRADDSLPPCLVKPSDRLHAPPPRVDDLGNRKRKCVRSGGHSGKWWY